MIEARKETAKEKERFLVAVEGTAEDILREYKYITANLLEREILTAKQILNTVSEVVASYITLEEVEEISEKDEPVHRDGHKC